MTLKNQIIQYIDDQQDQMIRFLEKLVCIQSGTKNKAGVDHVGSVIKKEMQAIGFSYEIHRQSCLGDHIILRSPGRQKDTSQILLVGHMDTVFPHDTDFNYFKQENEKSFGPGVADMKGGLVVGIFALKALAHNKMLDRLLPVSFIFNSDEEIGSPRSRNFIQKEAQNSKMAFVLEAGGLNNEVVTGRKGRLSVELSIKGRAGHAAFAKGDKASAILELAHKTIALEQLNNPQKGILVNVGIINGGMGPNTIPEKANAVLDFRFNTSEDYHTICGQIKRICRTQTIDRVRSDYRVYSVRPPMPASEKNITLFKDIEAVARQIGLRIAQEYRPGVSDANLIAQEGIPVIDGLGPAGGLDHSKDEFIITQSLFERAKLLGCILSDIQH